MEYVLIQNPNIFQYFLIVDVGTAVITSAGNLPSKYVIHIVSPIWNGGDNGEEEKLANAVINA